MLGDVLGFLITACVWGVLIMAVVMIFTGRARPLADWFSENLLSKIKIKGRDDDESESEHGQGNDTD